MNHYLIDVLNDAERLYLSAKAEFGRAKDALRASRAALDEAIDPSPIQVSGMVRNHYRAKPRADR